MSTESSIPRLAIIAALPREIASLVKNPASPTDWHREPTTVPDVLVYTSSHAVVVCAGMGAARAELATRTALSYGPISYLLSVGWAGALKPEIAAGSIHHPAEIIDAEVSAATPPKKFFTVAGTGILVTVSRVATAQDKLALVEKFDADFVDMEAATVARIADEQGIAFAAVKAISDEHDAALPDMRRFTTPEGGIREAAFGLHVALRPWLWFTTIRMAQSSTLSARNLCIDLQRIVLAYQSRSASEDEGPQHD